MRIDLNADLGEGFGRWTLGDDEALLGLISSANVACGFHAGDPVIMRQVCASAVRQSVAIGAQVGYRDLAGFGRRRIDIAADELTADIVYQLGALQAFAQSAGDRVRYLKPHGALYNTAVVDAGQAGAVVAAVLAFDPSLPIVTLAGSVLATLAEQAALTVVAEVFADRGYLPDGTLAPRSHALGLLDDPAIIAARAVGMVVEHQVSAVDGTVLTVAPDSVCVHGDTPGAVQIAEQVRAALLAAGATIAPFV
ncbi:MAG: hypothetical protein JWN95_496 [Frankiales bacterium]|nr:hypothetical protein [Frankiales bacterium]